MARRRSYEELGQLLYKIQTREANRVTKTGRRKAMSKVAKNAIGQIEQYRANIRNAYSKQNADYVNRFNAAIAKTNNANTYDEGMKEVEKLRAESKRFTAKKISPRVYRQGLSIG